MKLFIAVLLLLHPTLSFGAINTTFAEQCVQRFAHQYGVPPEFIGALIDVESCWRPDAVSYKGAMGLMQLMPDTARRYGAVHPLDVEENIAAGTRYVTALMWEFHGDLRLVAAAYYAGDRWVTQQQLGYRSVEIAAYVQAVQARYRIRKSSRGVDGH
jgi:soluble lytic murein transglycosylase-like protein